MTMFYIVLFPAVKCCGHIFTRSASTQYSTHSYTPLIVGSARF